MSNTERWLGTIGTTSNATQLEIERALARAEGELAQLQRGGHTQAERARYNELMEAFHGLTREYIPAGIVYRGPDRVDTSVERNGATRRERADDEETESEQQEEAAEEVEAPTPSGGRGSRSRNNSRPVLDCPRAYCAYSTVHEGHFRRHMEKHAVNDPKR